MGSRKIVVRAATDEASSHGPNPICRARCAARETPKGFAEVAVSHRAEETLRLAIPQNMR